MKQFDPDVWPWVKGAQGFAECNRIDAETVVARWAESFAADPRCRDVVEYARKDHDPRPRFPADDVVLGMSFAPNQTRDAYRIVEAELRSGSREGWRVSVRRPSEVLVARFGDVIASFDRDSNRRGTRMRLVDGAMGRDGMPALSTIARAAGDPLRGDANCRSIAWRTDPSVPGRLDEVLHDVAIATGMEADVTSIRVWSAIDLPWYRTGSGYVFHQGSRPASDPMETSRGRLVQHVLDRFKPTGHHAHAGDTRGENDRCSEIDVEDVERQFPIETPVPASATLRVMADTIAELRRREATERLRAWLAVTGASPELVAALGRETRRRAPTAT